MLCRPRAAAVAALSGAFIQTVAIQIAWAAPDIELGRYLANQCMTCHRAASADGVAIPNIFGMAEARFVERIKAYRDRTLPNAVMQVQAAGLKDDEVEALAAYFSRTRKP